MAICPCGRTDDTVDQMSADSPRGPLRCPICHAETTGGGHDPAQLACGGKADCELHEVSFEHRGLCHWVVCPQHGRVYSNSEGVLLLPTNDTDPTATLDCCPAPTEQPSPPVTRRPRDIVGALLTTALVVLMLAMVAGVAYYLDQALATGWIAPPNTHRLLAAFAALTWTAGIVSSVVCRYRERRR